MRKVLGAACMTIGIALLSGALILLLWNQKEADDAGKTSMDAVAMLNEAIACRSEQETTPADVLPGTPPELLAPQEKQMAEVTINGYPYIGYLSIPDLGLDLPVMSQWSDSRLKIAPCRYSGTTMENNLVLVAHNYRTHFGYLGQLKPGDPVMFTDMDGDITCYQVAAVDVVLPEAVQEVTMGAFDLALVTCTYGGKTRLVVYCDVYSSK